MIAVTRTSRRALALFIFIAGALSVNAAFADKPEWAGGGNHGGRRDQAERRDDQRGERRDDDRRETRNNQGHAGPRGHFEERHTAIVRDYYSNQMRGGHCPPGLAKKRNGCMPPGQAKKWEVGRRLAPDVVYYRVPQPLLTQIGPPPSGFRYVRVASDILMISTGTGMVVDAIRDLGRS